MNDQNDLKSESNISPQSTLNIQDPAQTGPILSDNPKNKKSRLNPLWVILSLSFGFLIIFFVVSGIVFYGQNGKHTKGSGAALFSEGSVGVIELNGVILDSKKILKKLERFEENEDIKAVVIRLNSPGGAVAPSQEIYNAVKKYKKPILSSMGSVAASGAYYVAVGTQKIFANPGTITGSIGVIMEFANLSKLYEWAKVERYVIKTGKFKDAGSEHRPMEADERALLQGMVDNVLGQFRGAVADGRKMELSKVVTLSDGRIFSGEQAKELGLVDQLGGITEAIAEAGKLGKIKGKPNVVYPEHPKHGIMDILLDDRLDEDSETSSASLGLIKGLTHAVKEVVPSLDGGVYWVWPGGIK